MMERLLKLQQQFNETQNMIATQAVCLADLFPRFRYVRPPKAMRRKIGRMIRRGIIIKRDYVLAVSQ